MANPEHVRLLKQGVKTWNDWREENPEIIPNLSLATFPEDDFSNINLSNAKINYACLIGVNLSRANLSNTRLVRSNLSRSNLNNANLERAKLERASLLNASLEHAYLLKANFREADLTNVDLSCAEASGLFHNTILRRAHLERATLKGAVLDGADLSWANLKETNLSGAFIGGTRFCFTNLGEALGLEQVSHSRPSSIGTETLYLSSGKIPEAFLRGCGIPEPFIVQLPALLSALQPIQFHSCFISYSSRDEEFARCLHSRMRQAELLVWFAPEDMKGGAKLYDQIDHAIQVHDRLLLVLSESSLQSKWVELEIRRARKVELREGRRKLFPIRLVGYEALQEWTCIDSATGEDLAEEVRSYYIPDFSNWKSHDDFERAFARLLSDLKASA